MSIFIRILRKINYFRAILCVIFISCFFGINYASKFTHEISVSGTIIEKDNGEKFHKNKSDEVSDGIKYYLTIKTLKYGYGCVTVTTNTYYNHSIGDNVIFTFNETSLADIFDKNIKLHEWYQEYTVYGVLMIICALLFFISALNI